MTLGGGENMDTIYVIRKLSGVRGDFGRQVFSCKLLTLFVNKQTFFSLLCQRRRRRKHPLLPEIVISVAGVADCGGITQIYIFNTLFHDFDCQLKTVI